MSGLNLVIFIVQQMMSFSVPLLIVALGGLFAERSGIVNIALDGTMIIGAFTGIMFLHLFQNPEAASEQGMLLLALLVSAVTGVMVSLVHAYASINMKADQTISGTAINVFAPAISIFVARLVLGVQQVPFANHFAIDKVPVLGDIPVIGPMFFQKCYLTTYIGFLILAVAAVVLYKTRFGLRLRSCGENPQAADSLGINVYKMRYAGTTISGALAGMGGFVYALTTANCASTGEVAGFGFLALAVMIFGNWKPLNIAGAALLFGLFKCIAASYTSIDINGDGVFLLAEIGVSPHFYRMLPYLITLIVLAFTSKKSRAPKAEGIPYDKGQR